MSVSQFPNANDIATNEIIDLVTLLLAPAINDPMVLGEFEVIFGAHMCAATEMLLNSVKLKNYVPFDPGIVRQIEDQLRSCR